MIARVGCNRYFFQGALQSEAPDRELLPQTQIVPSYRHALGQDRPQLPDSHLFGVHRYLA